MTKKLVNLRIGRKLALVFGGELVPLIGIACLTLWGVNAIQNAVGQEHLEADKMLVIQQAASDMGRVAETVGHIALGTRCEMCHGDRAGADPANRTRLVERYLHSIADLKSREEFHAGPPVGGRL